MDKNKIKEAEDALDLLNDAKEMARMIHEAYDKKDISIVEKAHEYEKKAIYQKAYRLMHNVPAYHIASCTRNLYLAGSPLIGLII